MQTRQVRAPLAIAGALLVVGTIAGPVSADANGAKNAFAGTANCGTAGSYQFVVNSPNGNGSGTNNNSNQAEWSPAHLSPGNAYFIQPFLI